MFSGNGLDQTADIESHIFTHCQRGVGSRVCAYTYMYICVSVPVYNNFKLYMYMYVEETYMYKLSKV